MITVNKLSIVIPVYNEENTIKLIVDKVKAVDLGNTEKEIVIVDDCSKDGTRKILAEIEKSSKDLKVFLKKSNSGKGATLKEGFKHISGDYVIVQDADLEYDPNDYKKLIKALSANGAEVIYGSRFSGKYDSMMSLHFFGNKLLTLITNLLFGVVLTDMETCYKLLPASLIRKIDIKSARFNFEPEITAKVLKSGLKIKEVPISYHGRTFSEGKKISWKDGLSAVTTLIKFRFFN